MWLQSRAPSMEKHSHNFHLFRWNKLVGAPSGDSIVRVAIGGFEGHEMVAALLDSNELLLRLVSDGVLLAKHLPLPAPSFSAVRGMAFDRSAQWLMLVCDDLTIGLLPVFFLLRGAAAAAQSAHHKQQQQLLLQQQQQQLQQQQEALGAEKLLHMFGLKKKALSQQAVVSKLPFSDLQDITIITPRISGRTGATGCIWW